LREERLAARKSKTSAGNTWLCRADPSLMLVSHSRQVTSTVVFFFDRFAGMRTWMVVRCFQ